MLGVPLILSVLFLTESFGTNGQYEGTVSGAYQPQSEYGEPTRFIIKLDNGKTVDVSATRMGPFKQGRRVLVRKWRSQWFHRTRYTFMHYIEEPSSTKLSD